MDADATPKLPRLHAVTYANVPDARIALSLGTAELHGFFPVVMGYGHEATWAYGLSTLANLVRDFIFNRTEPEDIVLFFDAWDVIFQGGENEIVSRYLEIEQREKKELIYHAERDTTKHSRAGYPQIDSIWRYLNCGLYIGRSRAMRLLYKEALPPQLVDEHGKPMRLQTWHTHYWLDHLESVTIDSKCELMQVVNMIDNVHVNGMHSDAAASPGNTGMVVRDGLFRNTVTNTTPLILHFAGMGHWPDWKHPDRIGTCAAYEFFRTAGHPKLAALMEKRSSQSKYFTLQPWKELCGSITLWDTWGVGVSRFGDVIVWLAHDGAQDAMQLSLAISGISFFFCVILCRRPRLETQLCLLFCSKRLRQPHKAACDVV